MTLVKCSTCGGEGYTDDEVTGEAVECPDCEGSGYVEKMPF